MRGERRSSLVVVVVVVMVVVFIVTLASGGGGGNFFAAAEETKSCSEKSLFESLFEKHDMIHSTHSHLPKHIVRAEKFLQDWENNNQTVVAVHCNYVDSIFLSAALGGSVVHCIQTNSASNESLTSDKFFNFVHFHPLLDQEPSEVWIRERNIRNVRAVVDMSRSEQERKSAGKWMKVLYPVVAENGELYVLPCSSEDESLSTFVLSLARRDEFPVSFDWPAAIVRMERETKNKVCNSVDATSFPQEETPLEERTVNQQEEEEEEEEGVDYDRSDDVDNEGNVAQAEQEEKEKDSSSTVKDENSSSSSSSNTQSEQEGEEGEGFQPFTTPEGDIVPCHREGNQDEKFVLYNPRYGRFNNQRRYLYNAIAVANALNRTLVVPHVDMKILATNKDVQSGWGGLIDFEILATRVRFCTQATFSRSDIAYFEAEEMDPQNVHQYKPHWFTNATVVERFKAVTRKLLYMNWLVDSWDFGEMKHSKQTEELEKIDAPIFGIPRSILREKIWKAPIHNERMYEMLLTDEYRWIRSGVVAHPNIIQIAASYITGQIHSDFIGVHLRMENWAGAPSCPICCHSADPSYFVNKTIEIARKAYVQTIFIAVDPALEYDFEPFFQLDHVRLLFPPLLFVDSVRQTLFEQEVLAQAKIFVGNLCSTWSLAVWEDRTILRNLPQETSVWW